jgi:hypothetical protein
MFITKKHLSRRALLKAGTAAIGLPLLDAMVPAATALAATPAAAKPRMGFFYLPHGAIMDNTRYGAEVNRWTPDKVGRDFDFKPILEPFKPFAKHLTVVSGLGNKPAESSAVHAIVPGTWLSAVHPRQSHAPYAGVTIDQIAAQHIGQDTPLPSLEVATEEEGGGAACDGTYGCAYGRTISFRTPTTPMPMEFDARKAFEKIFGRGKSEAQRKAVSSDYQSLLDMVLGEAGSLKKALGPADRSLVDDYLDSVREIERRIELMGQRDLTKIALPDVPVARPSFDQLLRLQFDLIAAAFQANMTRIVSYMMAAEVSNQSYAHIGIPDAFHPLSHHADNKAAMEKLAKLQRYHTSVFADFLAKLDKMPDGDRGSVLDNSVFLYGGNMSNSNVHNQFPLPTLVVGRAGGAIKGGQHLRYPDHTPLANLLFTLLLRAGVPVDKVGDSTHEMAEV